MRKKRCIPSPSSTKVDMSKAITWQVHALKGKSKQEYHESFISQWAYHL